MFICWLNKEEEELASKCSQHHRGKCAINPTVEYYKPSNSDVQILHWETE